jgi:azurin
METHHDTNDHGSGFWKVANVVIGFGFAAFALLAGAILIIGGIKATRPVKTDATAPAAPTASASSAAAPVAAATAAPAASGDVAIINLKPGVANPMSFDITSFSVKAGQKVKLTFSNESATPLQHNFVLCKAGTKDNVITLANAMMTDMPKWMAKGFIPESPDVLHHTKLLNIKESETLEFTAPADKGDYPYLCTFPGHSLIMNGVMKVE